MKDEDIRLEDRIEFALRDAGFDPDSAFEYAQRAAMASIALVETSLVTHDDYRALEEQEAKIRTEHAEIRKNYDKLHAELASLRARVGELVEADREVSEAGKAFDFHLNESSRIRMVNASSRFTSALEAFRNGSLIFE